MPEPAQIYTLLAVMCYTLPGAFSVPTGEHTCTGVTKIPVTVLVNVTVPVTFRSYTWCLRVPPRCSKYSIQLRDRVQLHTEMHNRTITVCCRGFVEMEGKCVPACPEGADCPYMVCNRTNHCHCVPGFTGLYCNDPCPNGVWGKDCKLPCDCPSGYLCHHLTGDCMVDDRPSRKSTTTTLPPTTTTPPTTQPVTTESTTFETVKTPQFRFPPPAWVEAAENTTQKKTTTKVMKDDFTVGTIKTLMEEVKPTTRGDKIKPSYGEFNTQPTIPKITTTQSSNTEPSLPMYIANVTKKQNKYLPSELSTITTEKNVITNTGKTTESKRDTTQTSVQYTTEEPTTPTTISISTEAPTKRTANEATTTRTTTEATTTITSTPIPFTIPTTIVSTALTPTTVASTTSTTVTSTTPTVTSTTPTVTSTTPTTVTSTTPTTVTSTTPTAVDSSTPTAVASTTPTAAASTTPTTVASTTLTTVTSTTVSPTIIPITLTTYPLTIPTTEYSSTTSTTTAVPSTINEIITTGEPSTVARKSPLTTEPITRVTTSAPVSATTARSPLIPITTTTTEQPAAKFEPTLEILTKAYPTRESSTTKTSPSVDTTSPVVEFEKKLTPIRLNNSEVPLDTVTPSLVGTKESSTPSTLLSTFFKLTEPVTLLNLNELNSTVTPMENEKNKVAGEMFTSPEFKVIKVIRTEQTQQKLPVTKDLSEVNSQETIVFKTSSSGGSFTTKEPITINTKPSKANKKSKTKEDGSQIIYISPTSKETATESESTKSIDQAIGSKSLTSDTPVVKQTLTTDEIQQTNISLLHSLFHIPPVIENNNEPIWISTAHQPTPENEQNLLTVTKINTMTTEDIEGTQEAKQDAPPSKTNRNTVTSFETTIFKQNIDVQASTTLSPIQLVKQLLNLTIEPTTTPATTTLETTLPPKAYEDDFTKDIINKKFKYDDLIVPFSTLEKNKKKHEKTKGKHSKEAKDYSQGATTKLEKQPDVPFLPPLPEATTSEIITEKLTPRVKPIQKSTTVKLKTEENSGMKIINDKTTRSSLLYTLATDMPNVINQNGQTTVKGIKIKASDKLENNDLLTEDINGGVTDNNDIEEAPLMDGRATPHETEAATGLLMSRTEQMTREMQTRTSLASLLMIVGAASVTLLSLTGLVWIYLKKRNGMILDTQPHIMAYELPEPTPIDIQSLEETFFCPTFTNAYGEKINRELREIQYDHPRRSQPEPLYAEIRH